MTTPHETPTLKIERVFNTTPEKLWAHWTDPKKYAKWLNPAPIDLVIHEFDVRPGGKIRFDMPQPDGNKNPQEGIFHSLTPYTELVTGAPDRSFLLTVRFEPLTRGTRMTVTIVGVPPEYHAMATVGWNTGLDKLEREVSAVHDPATPGGFSIERTFKAAPQKVWDMWTTKEGIMKWWAVSARDMGYAFAVRHMDVRVGGTFAFEMANKEHQLVNRGTYTRVTPHTDLAWTWHFDIFLAPGEKPYDVPITISLARTPAGGTAMRFTQGPLATPEHSEGSRQGVLSNLEKLARALGE